MADCKRSATHLNLTTGAFCGIICGLSLNKEVVLMEHGSSSSCAVASPPVIR
jgi:hypothetical protein